MTLSHQNLVKIVEQSSTLTERLSSNFIAAIDSTQTEKIESRLEQWCQSIAEGQWNTFEKRLAWDNLMLETVRPLLGTVRLADPTQLPTWTQTLEKISQCAIELDQSRSIKSPFNPNYPLPFEDILLPFLIVAKTTLRDRLRSIILSVDSVARQVLSNSVFISFEQQLLRQLIDIAGKTLQQEFSQTQSIGCNLLNLVVATKQNINTRENYDSFVQFQRQDGFTSFFKAYPVLAKLMALKVDQWIEATQEFIERLQGDFPEIVSRFATSDRSQPTRSKIKAIKTGLSDTHYCGRSVVIVMLETGAKVVYKPKALDLEAAYNQLLTWCNHQDKGLDFKVLKILNRQDYGWMEYVIHHPCQDQEAVQRFYQRSGRLLYLLAMLGSTDCHHENLIADGEHLVLIDIEAIMHPIPNAMMGQSPKEKTDQEHNPHQTTTLLQRAVFGTGLLPRWTLNHNGHIAYDISALGSTADPQTYAESVIWKHINTDKMHLVKERYCMHPKFNIPILDNQPVQVEQYLDDLEAGFRQMHEFCLKEQAQWLSHSGPLSQLRDQRVRFIFRATRAYSTVLKNSLLPEHLKDGIDRSIEIERLGRAYIWTEDQPKTWPLFTLECQSIEHLDIPYFDTPVNTQTLCLRTLKPIEEYFRESSYHKVQRRFQTLEKTNLEGTIAVIRGAFYAKAAHHPKSIHDSTMPPVKSRDQHPLLSHAELCQTAQAIADKILDNAIPGQNGESSYWLGYHYIPTANRFQMQPLNSSFYNGNAGIALFLAALEKATKNANHYQTSVMQALHRNLKALKRRIEDASTSNISHISSVGVSLYGLVRTAQFLNDPTLMEDALMITRLITPERVVMDMKVDVARGVSGMLLGLLVLYQETGDETVLERACVCGRHLIQHQKTTPTGLTWVTSTEAPLSRFAHGSLGISYSLMRLYQTTQNSEFLESATMGFQYEHNLFSQAQNDGVKVNQQDLPDTSPSIYSPWEYGLCALEYSQMGCASGQWFDEIQKNIEVVLKQAQSSVSPWVDSLYCGAFSRIEFLLTAAIYRSQMQSSNIALQQATQQVHQAKLSGGFQLFATLPCHVFNPNLFHGTAGIGYELLRLADPDTFPSILLWK